MVDRGVDDSYQAIEDPDASKDARLGSEISGVGDNLAEFT